MPEKTVDQVPLPKPQEVAPPREHALRILLAEDNQVNQQIALRMLKKLGHEADVVEHGKAVIEALKHKTYDLILMDCQMPEMDGYEATKIIRHDSSLPNKITIVAVTANAMKGDMEKCLEAGMTDYISKPIQFNGMKELINKYFPTEDVSKLSAS
jgi:CheY-like chemotaxis protein